MKRILSFLIFLKRVNGSTQQKIAKSLGVSRSYISEIYNGKKEITLSRLVDFAELYGFQPWELLWLESYSNNISILGERFKQAYLTFVYWEKQNAKN